MYDLFIEVFRYVYKYSFVNYQSDLVDQARSQAQLYMYIYVLLNLVHLGAKNIPVHKYSFPTFNLTWYSFEQSTVLTWYIWEPSTVPYMSTVMDIHMFSWTWYTWEQSTVRACGGTRPSTDKSEMNE